MGIKQNEDLSVEEKIQRFIDFFSNQLQLNLSLIKGQEIVNGHGFHLQRFLQVLEKFMGYYQSHSQEGSGSRCRVKSDPNNSQIGKGGEYNVPRCARQKIKQQMLEFDDEPLPQQKESCKKEFQGQKTSLQENKKREIGKINDFMLKENQKVLANLAEGGRLERIIMDMYKRF